MKTAIIFLGLTMMTITSSNATNRNFSDNQAGMKPSFIIEMEQGEVFESTQGFGDSKKVAPIADQTIVNPETILNVSYERDVQELIEQDKKIVESTFESSSFFVIQEQSTEDVISTDNQIIEAKIDTTVRPLFIERTVEDVILEDQMIIENECNNIAQPLDFNLINQVQTVLKKDKMLF